MSQDLKVNLCGLQQDNVVTVTVRIIMWESPCDSHAVAIQWVRMVKDCNVLTLILFSLFTNRIWTRYIINGFLSDTSVRVMYKSEVA